METGRTFRKVQMSDLYPLIRDTLASGGTFTLTITGSSMCPFLAGGRDQVTLSAVPAKIKKNDLLLYRRKSGQFVLHRIVKVCRDGTYICCGDHQQFLEKGLEKSQMIALASEFVRKGRHFTDRNVFYRMYRTVWTWIIPLRSYVFAIRNKIAGGNKKSKS